MLEILYQVILNGAAYTLVCALALSLYQDRRKVRAAWWSGTVPAVFIAVLILYTEFSLHLTRQINGILAGMALAGSLPLIAGIGSGKSANASGESSEHPFFAVVGTSFFLLGCWGWSQVLRTAMAIVKRSAENAAGIDQGLLARWLGFGVGVILVLTLGVVVYRLVSRLEGGERKAAARVFLVLISVKNLLELLYGLLVLRVYEPGDGIYAVMTRHMNNPEISLSLVLGGGLIAALISLRRRRPPRPEEGDNPAQRRKKLASAIVVRNAHRWAGAVLTAVLGTGAAGYISAHTEREIRPSTRIEMNAEGGYVVPKEVLEDGHIHRYVWRSPDGVDIVFWLIKKRENNYGVVLDGCEICGPAGYLERGDDIVCVACDVVMNRGTIGLKGGCNPIPVGRFLDSPDSITVLAEDLLLREDVFRGHGGHH